MKLGLLQLVDTGVATVCVTVVSSLAGKKKLESNVSMLLKSCASPYMLPFSLCNKKRLAI